jgi:hypothetical protein
VLVDNFTKVLNKKNSYDVFFYNDWIELGRMLAGARGLISYAGAASAFGAYVSTRVLALYDNEDPQRTGPFYFLSDVSIMGINNPSILNSTSTKNEILKERKTFNMSEVFGQAHGFFRL